MQFILFYFFFLSEMAYFGVWELITLFSVEGATFVQAADAILEGPKELNVHSMYDSSALHRPVLETLQVQSEKIWYINHCGT